MSDSRGHRKEEGGEGVDSDNLVDDVTAQQLRYYCLSKLGEGSWRG